jgi:hypothetical protein
MNSQKIIIYSLSWYSRAVYRKLKKDYKNIEVVAFVDNDKTKQEKNFDGVPILKPSSLKKLSYDFVYIGGRESHSISQNLIQEQLIQKNKIFLFTKNDIKLEDSQLKENNKIIINILKEIKNISQTHSIKYWLDFSSLLALKRNQFFSEYSDTDISLVNDSHMKILLSSLQHIQDKLEININTKYNKIESDFLKEGDLLKITLTNLTAIEDNEPICIDICRKYFFQNKCFQPYPNGKFFSCDKKHFDDQDWSSIHNIQVPQPLFLEDYIQSIYGNDWRVPNNDWQVSDYKNII